MIEILNRYTKAVIYKSETAGTVSEAVAAAAKGGADLSRSNLSGADLSRANLIGADLSGADLSRANLRSANLIGADLSRSNLSGADLSRANLYRSNLSGANLSGADLSGAQIDDITLARASIVPEGDLIVWKKCSNGVIVRLLVPKESRRSNATGRKCRCEFADVLEVIGDEVGISQHDGKTEYRVGQRVTCDSWCEDRWQECAGGIHFYITRAEAEVH